MEYIDIELSNTQQSRSGRIIVFTQFLSIHLCRDLKHSVFDTHMKTRCRKRKVGE